jgi:hypothetical protein
MIVPPAKPSLWKEQPTMMGDVAYNFFVKKVGARIKHVRYIPLSSTLYHDNFNYSENHS